MMSSDELYEAHMKAARAYAQLSKARRAQVGAVLVREGRIVSVGYNGTVSGSDNRCEDTVDGVLVTRPGVIHAEMNAIAFAAKHGVATEGCTMVTTMEPCINCARIMFQSGVVEVVYADYHPTAKGAEFLRANGVPVWRTNNE